MLTIPQGFDIQADSPKRFDIQAGSFVRFLTFRQAVLTGVSQLSLVFAGICQNSILLSATAASFSIPSISTPSLLIQVVHKIDDKHHLSTLEDCFKPLFICLQCYGQNLLGCARPSSGQSFIHCTGRCCWLQISVIHVLQC